MASYGTNITGTTAAVFRPNIWAEMAQKARESVLVLVPLVRHYDKEIKNQGQTVEIPFVSNLTAYQKSANTVISVNAPTETKVTVTIDQHWATPVMIEDFADIQSAYDLAALYSEKCGYSVAEKMDNYVAAAMTSGFTTNVVGTYGSALTYAVVRAGKLALDVAKVPTQDRSFVVTPKGHDDLLGIDQFTRYDAMGASGQPSPFETGRVGYILGMKVYMSQNLVVTAATPTQNNCLMFHKDAYAIAVQKDISFERQRKTEYLADLILASALWGGVVLRNDHGVLVKC